MTTYKVFETERLLLKPTCKEDAQFFFELQNNPTWIKYIGDRNIKTIDDASDFIVTKIIPQLEKLGYSNFTVVRKSDNLKIGSCGLYDREELDGIDIGFAFLPKFQNKGYAYETANKIKNIAFTEFGIRKLYAVTTKENIPSQNLLKKLGLTLNGTLKLPEDTEESLFFKIDL